MRKFVNEHGTVIGVVAIILAIGIGFLAYGRSRKTIGINGYFVDEETGEELIMPRTSYPPLVGKGGKPTVVGVFKFSCDGGKTAKIGYYFKYTDTAKQQ